VSKPFFTESQQRILGLARQFDFVIKLTSPNAYSSVVSGNPSVLPVYAHEWTHFVQFLTTSLGNLVAETERLLFFVKFQLVMFTSAASSGELALPLQSMLRDRPHLQSDPRIRATIGRISSLAGRMQALCVPWGKLLCSEAFNLEMLHKKRPFHLDTSERCLIYRCNSGSDMYLPITATQLLEHAAKANEIMLTGGNIRIDELVPTMFDYFGIFLYLVQEGRLCLVDVRPGVVRMELTSGNDAQVRTLGALICMYASCQISQMLYVDTEGERTAEHENDEFSVKFVEERLRASTTVFCRIIESFDTVASMLDRGDLSARDRVEELCRTLHLPSYHAALIMQLVRTRGAIETVTPDEKPTGEEVLYYSALRSAIGAALKVGADDTPPVQFSELYKSLFLERSLAALEVLVQSPETSINPLFHSEGLPAPYVVFETDQGARRTILRLPGQGEPKVMPIPKPWMSHFLEQSMLIDKILLDRNLACYRDGVEEEEARVSRASLGCPHFVECFRRPKTDRLGFCTKTDWARMAEGTYRVWEAVGPLL